MSIPSINAGQGLVKHWTITVVAECTSCGMASTIMLINAIRVECPRCGAVHVLNGFVWDGEHPDETTFDIRASEPRIKQLHGG